jgi:lantibiotic modifying enzyme
MLDGAKTAAAWCHGSVGIGLAHLDLDPGLADASTRQVLRRTAAATWRLGIGWNHCACHGDFGAWELLEHAIALGEGPKDLTVVRLRELLLTSLEDHGPSCGMTRAAFAPGLMPGLGGIAYQLLRMHPDNGLPSLLTPGGGL